MTTTAISARGIDTPKVLDQHIAILGKTGSGKTTRASVKLSHNGLTKTVAEWAHELKITPPKLYSRIDKLGWSTERALSEPAFKGKNATHKSI